MSALGRYCLSILSITLVLVPAAAIAQRLTIEAENYTSCGDAGGAQVQSIESTGCSGGYFLYGLDTPGEWVQYDLAPNTAGIYSLGMKCRGTLNRDYAFRALFTPLNGGSPQTVDFNFAGEGFG